MSGAGHDHALPSPWVEAWAHVIVPGGRVLDLACGSGRHARWLAERGFSIVAVDRDAEALQALASLARIHCRQHDLEAHAWPFPGETFDAIVVTNYLHRPLLSTLVQSLSMRGVLIYETFARGNGTFGRPANPDFLLNPGELLRVAGGSLHILAYEDRFVDVPKVAMVQRICAVRAADSTKVWI